MKKAMVICAALLSGCASMAQSLYGYQPKLAPSAEFDDFNGTWNVTSSMWGLRAKSMTDNPSYLSIMKTKKGVASVVGITTIVTLPVSFYPSYAEDQAGNKESASLLASDVKCDSALGCKWISRVFTHMDWQELQGRVMAANGQYRMRIHGNGYADIGILPCQIWELETELNRLSGVTTTVTDFGGQPCYKN